MDIAIVNADYLKERHAEEIGLLMDSYAADPMGGGKSLTQQVKYNIAKELSKLPYAFSVIVNLCTALTTPAYRSRLFAGSATCAPSSSSSSGWYSTVTG